MTRAPWPRTCATSATTWATWKGLTASIAAVGVIEALTVVPLPDGGHRIVAGHRRCAAAILADHPTVPCLLRPELAADDDDKAGHAGHVARMVGENLHREGISAIEEARAYQTMLDLGENATAIARQTGQPRKRVLKPSVSSGPVPSWASPCRPRI